MTLTKNRPVIRVKIRMRRKVKRMNPYTFMGCLIGVPKVGDVRQFPIAADTTDVNHVDVTVRSKYYEWNPDFNMLRV